MKDLVLVLVVMFWWDLETWYGGIYRFVLDANVKSRTIVVYPPEKDVDVKIKNGEIAARSWYCNGACLYSK